MVDAASHLGLEIRVRVFPEGTKTAVDAAQAVGCDVSAIVKSLVFTVDGRAVVALVPGDRRLDPAKLAEAAGGNEARRASLEVVREATGYVAGGTPPLGYPEPIPVFADEGLRRNETVWAAAGTPTTVFPISPDELARVSSAVWADVAEDPHG